MGTKLAKDYLPFVRDDGAPTIAFAGAANTAIQSLTFVMVAGGVVNFADQGMQDMDSAVYQVIVQNQTDAADEATVAKTAVALTITGPDNDDVLDIVIIGKLATQ